MTFLSFHRFAHLSLVLVLQSLTQKLLGLSLHLRPELSRQSLVLLDDLQAPKVNVPRHLLCNGGQPEVSNNMGESKCTFISILLIASTGM